MEEKVELELEAYNKLYDAAKEYENAKHVIHYGYGVTVYTESDVVAELARIKNDRIETQEVFASDLGHLKNQVGDMFKGSRKERRKATKKLKEQYG